MCPWDGVASVTTPFSGEKMGLIQSKQWILRDEERPYYVPQLDPGARSEARWSTATPRSNLPIGPNVAVLVIDMSPIFVDELLFPRAEKGTGVQCVQAIKSISGPVSANCELPIIYTTGYVFQICRPKAAPGCTVFRRSSGNRVAAMDTPKLA